jgi:uncharacterized protein YegP (UPF0339 family)
LSAIARHFASHPFDTVGDAIRATPSLLRRIIHTIARGNTMTGYFEVTQSRSDKYSFNLKSKNHKVILSSQTYNTRQGALNGVASVQRNALLDNHFGRLTAKSNEPYFILRAGNGEVIGRSEMYASTSGMEDGIASVKANAASTTMRES